jgi:Thioesterase-like superfamily
VTAQVPVTTPGTPSPARSFARAAAVAREAPGRFRGNVDAEWTIGGRANGGYLLAMLARAAVETGNQPHPIAASAHFLRSPAPGPAAIEAEVLRRGRAVDQVRVRMAQGGEACVDAIVTNGSLNGAPDVIWAGGLPPRPAVGFEDCVPARPAMPDDTRVAILDQVELRLDPASTGFTRGEPSGRGELRGWLRLKHGETFDAAALLYAVDSFPPASFDVAFSGWVPTLELTAYVRGIPAPGPVQVLQQARMIAGGRVDEACFVWDAQGRLVAQATQLAGIRTA